MRLIIICIIFLSLMQSCRKGPSDDGIETLGGLDIHYTDSTGNDLFNNYQRGYIKDSVRIYDYITPVGISFYKTITWVDYFPGSTSTIDISDPYNKDVRYQYASAIIHLKKGVDDTLKLHVVNRGSLFYHDSTWYNGVLKATKDTFSIKH